MAVHNRKGNRNYPQNNPEIDLNTSYTNPKTNLELPLIP